MSKQETIQRLINIKMEIKDLIAEALELIESESEFEGQRAERYWYAHIEMALDNDHSYLGGSMVTMEDSIEGIMGTHVE
jgi:hypothetical protein